LAAAGFDRALGELSRGVAAAFRQEPELIQAIGDRGAFAVVAAGLARQNDRGLGQGVTLRAIQDFAVPNRLASARRVRSLVANLARTGAARPLGPGGDGRERPWRLGGWLPPALERWWAAYARALGALELPSAADPEARLASYLRRSVAAFPEAGAPLARQFGDLSVFLDRKGGHAVLLHLVSHAHEGGLGAEVGSELSRKGMARELGVSRAQVTLLMAEAERRDLLRREPAGTAVRLAPAAYSRARLWIAHEIAWAQASP
jgi:hypothetical protein